MNNCQIKIELLSDLCVSDGGVYNSFLDIDICHDRYGFPYIPAKRLKGCLRECALELNDWGEHIEIEKMFGEGGKASNKAKVRISNARLANHDQMKKDIFDHSHPIIFHPQNVLNHFSYVRTQTSIDYETGVAEDNSLRTMRVANKGLCFYADVELESMAYFDDLKKCCNVLSHIGMSRTRGLGEVKVTLKPLEKQKENKSIFTESFSDRKHDCLEYSFLLLEPVICKSVAGGEARTQDYIEGSKIFGIFASELKKKGINIIDFLKTNDQEKLICSNAYLEIDGQRLTEVPATYYDIKDNESEYIDQTYCLGKNENKIEDLQLDQIKHTYISKDDDGNIRKHDVKIEERYHHSRPEDKSIGRAKDDINGSGKFYQMSSIEAGQTFKGYIYGSPEQIQELKACIYPKSIKYIGYGRSSEYGKIKFQKVQSCSRPLPKKMKGSLLQLKLESPTIIYSNHAMYSTKITDLEEEVLAVLDLKDCVEKIESYVNYTSIGGFNVTWGYKKPVIECFDKGTVLLMKLKKDVSLLLPEQMYIGERNQEGFGEISLEMVDISKDKYVGKILSDTAHTTNQIVMAMKSDFTKEICDDLFENYVKMLAVQNAKCHLAKLLSNHLKPTVSNMMSMEKTPSNMSLKDIQVNVQKRFHKKSLKKQEKLQTANDIIKMVQEDTKEMIANFEQQYYVRGYVFEQDKLEMQYLLAFLTEIKYLLRKREERKENSGDGK